VLALCAPLARGQMRIVQYNSGAVKPGLTTVLDQIGHETVNGVARPIDMMVVEEQQDAAMVQNLVSTLNGIYGPGTYAAAPYVGVTSGGGLPSIVYRPGSFSLVGSPVGIGTVSSTTNARQTIKYQFRPVGYGADADVYVYAAHLKASSGSSNAARRNAEAITDRADADAMGSGKNIIYAGDFNLYSGNEAAYQTFTAAGNAQAVDPLHPPLTWSGSANRAIFTQSPATTSAYGGQVTGGMNDRFDFQLSTAGLNDSRGVALIPGSYRAFGNNGTVPLSGAINSASNTWNNAGLTVPRTSVLDALAQASDHIPVVADYQLPAKMSVSIAPIPPRVIVGANVSPTVTVTNSAPVAVAIGADKLDYSLTSAGNVSGSASGVATATLGGNTHALTMNTAAPGVQSGTVSVTSASQAVAGGTFSQALTTTVLAHATPSFSPVTATSNLQLDFGVRAKGLDAPSAPFTIHNLAHASGFTADLDVDSFSSTGDIGKFATTLAAYSTQAVTSDRNFAAALDTSSTGSFSSVMTIHTSDEDIPGATARTPLTLTLQATIALGGDANLDGSVDVSDLGSLASNWQSPGGWSQGDFNRDDMIDVTDLGLLAMNWQQSATDQSLSQAMSSVGLGAASNVPEPIGAGAALAFACAAVLPRPRRNFIRQIAL
jgi:hypothetical protein